MTQPSPRDLPFEVSLYEAVLARDPSNIEALTALGEAYTKQGRHTLGLEVDQRLARLRPQDPLVRYNLACSLALTGQVDAAFSALSLAVELGYSDTAHLERDPDLEALRADSRFQEVRQRLAARAGAPLKG